MDKNTLWGLILMGAIFFGFMYCNKPAQQANQQAATETAVAQPAESVLATDSLDKSAEQALAQAVRSIGAAAEGGNYVL